jgi:hypothetical protein
VDPIPSGCSKTRAQDRLHRQLYHNSPSSHLALYAIVRLQYLIIILGLPAPSPRDTPECLVTCGVRQMWQVELSWYVLEKYYPILLSSNDAFLPGDPHNCEHCKPISYCKLSVVLIQVPEFRHGQLNRRLCTSYQGNGIWRVLLAQLNWVRQPSYALRI